MDIRQNLILANNKIDRYAPEILTSFGIFGVITTMVLSVKATVEATKELEMLRKKTSEPSKKQIFESVWYYYVPPVGTAVLTISSILGSSRLSSERLAAMSTLYLLSEKALDRYKEKVIATFGSRKADKVSEEILQDTLNSNPVEDSTIIITGNGKHLCFDVLSGRYFQHDVESIRRAQNDFNERLFSDMYMTVNDWYDFLGLEHTELGRQMGWDVQNGNLIIKFSAKIATNGEPCIVIEYRGEPRHL